MVSILKYSGKVILGKNRGKLMGFPTANVRVHKKIDDGIYASTVKINGIVFVAATFIGNSKTFNEKDRKSESYILDFNENIYGKWISVSLFKKIRSNKKFKTEELLVNQMKADVLEIRKLFDTGYFINGDN